MGSWADLGEMGWGQLPRALVSNRCRGCTWIHESPRIMKDSKGLLPYLTKRNQQMVAKLVYGAHTHTYLYIYIVVWGRHRGKGAIAAIIECGKSTETRSLEGCEACRAQSRSPEVDPQAARATLVSASEAPAMRRRLRAYKRGKLPFLTICTDNAVQRLRAFACL